jgi:hypothetical protein
MRRVLAAIYAGAGLVWYGIGATNGLMTAFYAGLACHSASIILLLFTTWTDLSATASAFRGTQVPKIEPVPLWTQTTTIPLAEEPEK